MNKSLLFSAALLLLHCQSATTTSTEKSEDVPAPATKEMAMSLPVNGGDSRSLSETELTGRFNPAGHPDFVTVGKPYATKSGMLLRKEAFDAFKKMWDAAKKDGINLTIISSTRNFDQQKAIWEGKWTRFAQETPDPEKRALRILEYSSMPGTSRHHWGTDIDINDLNNPSFEGKGRHKKVYDWLTTHAATYGFGQPYTPKGTERPFGYNEEKWHWSYLPLAREYRTAYLKTLTESAIKGFKGAETAKGLQVVERYVGGVSKACQ